MIAGPTVEARGEPGPAAEVTIYGRPGCHLCTEARAMLTEVATEAGARLRIVEIDIESDSELLRSYLERIPVIAIEGTEISELVPNRDALRTSLDTLVT